MTCPAGGVLTPSAPTGSAGAQTPRGCAALSPQPAYKGPLFANTQCSKGSRAGRSWGPHLRGLRENLSEGQRDGGGRFCKPGKSVGSPVPQGAGTGCKQDLGEMVTPTLQVCPEQGRRPTRTLPYSATAPLLGCFTACLTESFLAVIQAHCPQVWVGGDGGLCLPLRAGGSAARWSTTRFWHETHLVSNPRSTLPTRPWAGRPITGRLCWVPDPAAPSGPTRGVCCTGCCVAGSEDSPA